MNKNILTIFKERDFWHKLYIRISLYEISAMVKPHFAFTRPILFKFVRNYIFA